MRTSHTHPLMIAPVRASADHGRIGITFCPGKQQPSAMTGAWSRDLDVDLDTVEEWGAAALVSLIEEHEIVELGVQDLGAGVIRRHMDWLHLPIRDVSVPGPDFERSWAVHGHGLRSRLQQGFDVVVHCKGGLGRAGTIAARLLVELGVEANEAIERVRVARPGAIEVEAQETYVRSFAAVPDTARSQAPLDVQDRAVGAFLGLAIGDALGTTLEFRKRDTYPLHQDIRGGGPFQLNAGQWTDDTAMALALAKSLIEHPRFNPDDLIHRFVDWRDNGAYSCTGRCFDIGMTVSAALRRWEQTGEAMAGSDNPQTAGNGSLMRLSPVALRYWNNRAELQRVATEQSRTTHGAPEAVGACVLFADMLADSIEGRCRSEVFRTRDELLPARIREIAGGSWRGKSRSAIESSGYVAHSLEAAIWSVARTADFRSAVITAANLGGDADTTAAIAGQLAGAIYGGRAIPKAWLEKLAWRNRLEDAALTLWRSSAMEPCVGI